jgi:glucosamine-phosphate N-acetyltransferase
LLKELALAGGEVIRFHLLSAHWLERGYLDVLSQLSPCELAPTAAKQVLLAQMQDCGRSLWPLVGVLGGQHSRDAPRVVACGTLLVEQKFIHGGGKAGHVEDLVVEQCFRGLGIGHAMLETLVSLAQEQGCYKVVLSCRRGAEGFYERCGFHPFEVEMRRNLAE